MPRKVKDIESAFAKKGFKKKEGDHHFFAYITMSGKKSSVFTKISHSQNEVGENLLSQMARQCKLSKDEFKLLIDCPLTRIEYEKALIEKGIIN